MAEQNPGSYVQLLRKLYFNRTGILFLLMALLSILMLLESARTKGSASNFWLALGASTAATTGYSFVQVMLTTRQFDEFLSDSIKTDIQKAVADSTDKAMELFRSLQGKYLPVATYQGLDEPNPRFNNDLNASMSASAHYLFRGLSGRYAVARLVLLSKTPRDVRIIMADPTKPAAVDFRARHDAGPSGGDEAFNQAKKEILDGIYMAIAGAYITRRKFDTIELNLTPIPHVDRVEICDDAIFVSRFSEAEDSNSRFPSTAKFGRESLIYQMFSQDCSSVLSSPYVTRFKLRGDLTEEDLLGRLAEAGLSIDLERWREMKRLFEEFRVKVSSQLMP